MAWRNGADPYRLYNNLDAELRPTTQRHECPACWAETFGLRYSYAREWLDEPCQLCGYRRYIEIPVVGEQQPRPHPHPRRYRNFLYGIAQALDEMDKKKGGLGGLRG